MSPPRPVVARHARRTGPGAGHVVAVVLDGAVGEREAGGKRPYAGIRTRRRGADVRAGAERARREEAVGPAQGALAVGRPARRMRDLRGDDAPVAPEARGLAQVVLLRAGEQQGPRPVLPADDRDRRLPGPGEAAHRRSLPTADPALGRAGGLLQE